MSKKPAGKGGASRPPTELEKIEVKRAKQQKEIDRHHQKIQRESTLSPEMRERVERMCAASFREQELQHLPDPEEVHHDSERAMRMLIKHLMRPGGPTDQSSRGKS